MAKKWVEFDDYYDWMGASKDFMIVEYLQINIPYTVGPVRLFGMNSEGLFTFTLDGTDGSLPRGVHITKVKVLQDVIPPRRPMDLIPYDDVVIYPDGGRGLVMRTDYYTAQGQTVVTTVQENNNKIRALVFDEEVALKNDSVGVWDAGTFA